MGTAIVPSVVGVGNGLACFRFNGNSCPDHRSKIVGELRIEPIALDAL
jgi:hypothetical protein